MRHLKIVLEPGAIKPERAHPTDAGLDFFSPVRKIIWPGSWDAIDTGVRVQIPDGYFGLVTSKSGLMVNNGIVSTGTIDSSYRGTIKAVLFNHSDKIMDIQPGQKITQLVILPCQTPEVVVVNKLDDSDRGENGFGSSGAFARKSYFALCCDQDNTRHNDIPMNAETENDCNGCTECDAPIDGYCSDETEDGCCGIDFDKIEQNLAAVSAATTEHEASERMLKFLTETH